MKTFQHFFNHKVFSQFSILEETIGPLVIPKKKRRRFLSVFHPFVPMSSLFLFKRCIAIVDNIVNRRSDNLKAKGKISIVDRFTVISHIGYSNMVNHASLPLSGIK